MPQAARRGAVGSKRIGANSRIRGFHGVLIGLALALAAVPSALSQAEMVDEAAEDDPDPTLVEFTLEPSYYCAAPETWCFNITKGDPREVHGGDGAIYWVSGFDNGIVDPALPPSEVELTFVNTADIPFSVNAGWLSERNETHENTPTGATRATTGLVPPGEEVIITFTTGTSVNTPGLYLWSDIHGYEARGMWMEVWYGGPIVMRQPDPESSNAAGTSSNVATGPNAPNSGQGDSQSESSAASGAAAGASAGEPAGELQPAADRVVAEGEAPLPVLVPLAAAGAAVLLLRRRPE